MEGHQAQSRRWSQGLKLMTPQLRQRQHMGRLSSNEIPSPKRPEGGALGPRAVLVSPCDTGWPSDNQVSSRDRVLSVRGSGEIAQGSQAVFLFPSQTSHLFGNASPHPPDKFPKGHTQATVGSVPIQQGRRNPSQHGGHDP